MGSAHGRSSRAGRAGRLGGLAVLVLAVSASAAFGATSRHAAGRATSPTITAGLRGHVPLSALPAANTKPSATPGGGASPAAKATSSALGAGLETFPLLKTAGVSFKVPSFSCAKSSDAEWLLPGIWVIDPTTGDVDDQVDLNLNCNDGTKLATEVICIDTSCESGTITPKPGDLIEAAFVTTDSGPSGFAGYVYDHTQGVYVAENGPTLPEAQYDVLEGDMGPAAFGVAAVPTFRNIAFTIATVNGFYVADWFPLQLNLQTSTHVQIASGTAKTTSFKTTFKTNS